MPAAVRMVTARTHPSEPGCTSTILYEDHFVNINVGQLMIPFRPWLQLRQTLFTPYTADNLPYLLSSLPSMKSVGVSTGNGWFGNGQQIAADQKVSRMSTKDFTPASHRPPTSTYLQELDHFTNSCESPLFMSVVGFIQSIRVISYVY